MTLFDISLGEYSDKALQLVNKGLNVVDFMDKLFLPFFINKKIDRFFPQRTAVNHANNLNFNGLVEPLLEINIPFFYERNTNLAGYSIYTDLKWSQFQLDGKSKKQVENLFGELLFFIRNKIVSVGGDIDNVEFIWFYPSSMSTNRIIVMGEIWKKHCDYYISKNVKIRNIPESIAPFHYYSQRQGISATNKPAISIDIGGGTTDAVLLKNNNAELFTSFKFAGNALFGDGFNSNPSCNGFVKKFKQDIKQKLADINQITLLTVLKEIEQKDSSVELISFFFSLENNVSLNTVTNLSFSQMLRDDPYMKPVLLLFASAIVYYMAEFMKMANLDSPRYLTLSGTGSKIFNILDGSTTKSQINLLVS
ncbi:MAG: hypothetical protein EBS34_13460, partial [Flavobacteriales bacterium]|nr:hypothetical protein [Flavobacteriales bacterium]